MEEVLQLWVIPKNILNKQSRTVDKGRSYREGIGLGLILLIGVGRLVTEIHIGP